MLYHSANDVFIGWCMIIYLGVSVLSAIILIGWLVYKVMNKKFLIGIIVAVATFILCSIGLNSASEDTWIDKEYQRHCVKIGEIYSICPELLMAMIEAESSGNPSASNGSCKGLMQVSEKWHKDRMKQLGVSDINDPYGNILVATDYLYELFHKYGDVAHVLMVYNGDSRASDFADGKCDMSEYAQKILARSEYLERIHGK